MAGKTITTGTTAVRERAWRVRRAGDQRLMTRLIAGNSSLAALGRERRSPVTSHSVNWFVYFPNKLVKGQRPDPPLGHRVQSHCPAPAAVTRSGAPYAPASRAISDARQRILSGLILVCGRFGRKLLTQVWWFDGSGDHERDRPRYSHRRGDRRDPRTLPDPSPRPELVIVTPDGLDLGSVLEASRRRKVDRSSAQVDQRTRTPVQRTRPRRLTRPRAAMRLLRRIHPLAPTRLPPRTPRIPRPSHPA